ncbi:flagellar biosynthetic protein FliQ, partial [Mixta calida]
MTPESVMAMGFQAIRVGLMIAAPLLLAALATGLVVSILQASTQINEMTLSFIPKILVIVAVAVALGPSMLAIMLDYMRA